MTDYFARLSPQQREQLRDDGGSDWIAPMLATLTDDRFSDPDWIYERKLDGERVLAVRTGSTVRLCSRNRKQLNDTYPELVDALARQACRDFIIDGEVVAFDGAVTSFARLQGRMQIADREAAAASRIAVYYYLFDIMRLDGQVLQRLPLRTRKALLKQAISFDRPLRYTTHRNRDGEACFARACDKGWEGIIAKRACSEYSSRRSTD